MNSALFILAAGSSERFGSEDKLMADLAGKPILQHVIEAASGPVFKSHYGIVSKHSVRRRALFKKFQYSVIDNPEALSGQGSSLALAAKTALQGPYDSLCIMLGDMPFVTTKHLQGLLKSKADKSISQWGDSLMPPIVIKRSVFSDMANIDPETGGKALFKSTNVEIIPLSFQQAQDIDTLETLDKWVNYIT